MLRVASTICTLAALLTACALDNPCPGGTVRGAGKCVAADSDAGAHATSDDPSATDDEGGAEGPLEPDIDASEPDPREDGLGDDDAGTMDEDADLLDTGADDAAVACSEDALSTWRSFQMSAQAVPAILTCYQTDPLCKTGVCDLSGCLTSAAQVDGCDRCVAAEVACAAQHCSVPCGIATTDDACRACACASGCLDAPAGCGLGGPDACADCSGASCSARVVAATDTIMVPIFFHLLHDRVDADTGLPAYAASGGEPETILDVDDQLAQINSVLESSRRDARRLRVIRAGVDYIPAPAPDVCPDPVAWTDAHRFFGGLNVVLTTERQGCPALAGSAFAGRANGASLLRTLGNLLGIAPAEQGAEPWQITSEQFVRMHNFTRWRLGAADAVPESERATSTGFWHGPADPIWDKLTNRDLALNNASVVELVASGPFKSLPLLRDFSVPATGATRRVLGMRLSAKVVGDPSDKLQIVVGASKYATPTIPRSAIRVADGMLVAEDAFDTSDVGWSGLRNIYGAVTWRVNIEDNGADLELSDVRLEIISGDRSFVSYDRHARGVADIMVYRPSTSELFTATNPANRSVAFGAPVRDQLPPLPDAQAKVVSGDVDGDGTVDLMARRGATIWIAFNKLGFADWRPGSIAGSDRPSESDEVLIGDFDGDGFGDLLRRRASLAVGHTLWAYFRGFGDGTFEPARVFEIPGVPYPLDIKWAIADLGRVGRSGIVARVPPALIVINYNLIPNGPPTTSGTMIELYGGWSPFIDGKQSAFESSDRLIALDADQDGSEDLVVRRTGTGEWFVALNQGRDSPFDPVQRLTIGGEPTAFADTDIVLGSMP